MQISTYENIAVTIPIHVPGRTHFVAHAGIVLVAFYNYGIIDNATGTSAVDKCGTFCVLTDTVGILACTYYDIAESVCIDIACGSDGVAEHGIGLVTLQVSIFS